MSEILFRVARALCEERTWPGAWERANEAEKSAWLRDATAAISAMCSVSRELGELQGKASIILRQASCQTLTKQHQYTAMIERCEKCNAVIALVGLRHNCAPKGKRDDANSIGRIPSTDRPAYSARMAAPDPSRNDELPKPDSSHRRGRPRIGTEDATLAATKPWAALGMSARTWYRRQKEQRQKDQTP